MTVPSAGSPAGQPIRSRAVRLVLGGTGAGLERATRAVPRPRGGRAATAPTRRPEEPYDHDLTEH